MSYGQNVFGLRQVVLTDFAGSNAVTLEAAMMFHFTEDIQTEEFVVEGVRIGVESFTIGVSWELEAGGLGLAAYGLLTGRTPVQTGSFPTRSNNLAALTPNSFPYIRIYGRARDDAIGDMHCRVHRAKLSAIEGTFRDGQFWVTSCAGVAVQHATLGFWEFVQHETATTI